MRRARGTIHIFTFKDGLLARAAHDLRLRLEDLEVRLDGESVESDLDLGSLRVDGPVEGGTLRPERFSAADRADIERITRDEVLRTARYPRGRFVGRAAARGEGFRVEGELALAGRSAPVGFDVRRQDGVFRAELEIRPSRWGVAPYRALLGAIRLQDRVRVELAVEER